MESFSWAGRPSIARFLTGMLFVILLSGCAAIDPDDPATYPVQAAETSSCPATEPAWLTPPEDAAVQSAPQPGYYFVNEDQSIWASAWWYGETETYLHSGEEGVKIGWFRPADATLEITGHRIDGDAPPLAAHAPCCYPTRFQSSGLIFPTGGCWEIAGRAAGSELRFVVEVAASPEVDR